LFRSHFNHLVYTEANGENREGDHFEEPGIDARIILKWILDKWYWGARTGSIWVRIGTGGGLL
jgi:hypothetical protein